MTERTDRELLKLAAKAAGIERGADRIDTGISITCPDGRHTHFPKWNPLEDDGDALRLAVKLDIEVEPVPFGGRAIVRDDDYGEQFDEESSDRMAATRRAIVRAIVRAAAAMAEGGER